MRIKNERQFVGISRGQGRLLWREGPAMSPKNIVELSLWLLFITIWKLINE